jgi:hypothetical protein
MSAPPQTTQAHTVAELAGQVEGIGLGPLLGFLGSLGLGGRLTIVEEPFLGTLFLDAGRIHGAVLDSETGLAALEAIVLGLTTPVLITIVDVRVPVALAVGLGLAVLCLLVAGLLRAEWAYVLGWLVQVAAIGLGFVIPIMFFLGGVFALLWATAYLLGRKIERERAAAYAAHDAGHRG